MGSLDKLNIPIVILPLNIYKTSPLSMIAILFTTCPHDGDATI